MKKLYLVCAAAAAIAALSLAGCANRNTGGVHHGDTAEGSYQGIESTESIYGMAAVTTAELLFEAQSGAESASLAEGENVAAVSASGSADAVAKAQEQAEEFNKYFNMLDSFLDRGATTTVVEDNTSSDAALKDYAFKLTVRGKDAAGESVAHTMYYSETKGEPKHTSIRDDDETTTIDVVTYTLNGVIEMGKTEAEEPIYYFMTGTRTETTTTETEGREEETEYASELKLRASATAGDTQNYVSLSHTQTSEQEAGEAETEAVYIYEIVKNGVKTESTQVSFETETEHGEEETEYTVRFLTGASRGAYTVERETENGRTEIAVSYAIDGATGTFVIVKDAGGGYRYKFSSNPDDDLIFPDFDD